jgi:hypothetical protein
MAIDEYSEIQREAPGSDLILRSPEKRFMVEDAERKPPSLISI